MPAVLLFFFLRLRGRKKKSKPKAEASLRWARRSGGEKVHWSRRRQAPSGSVKGTAVAFEKAKGLSKKGTP